MATFPTVPPGTSPRIFPFRFALPGAVALLAAGLLCAPANAQFRASIQGVVTDPTGAVIPGVTLTLTNNATNQKQESTSNGVGVYNFNALPPGTYTLVASRTGFATKTLDDLQIIPEQANALNIQLAVSTAPQQSVTVNAAQLPLIDTENATIGATVSSDEIQHMPSFGRDVFQLSQFAPGTVSDMSQAAGGGSYALPGTAGPGGPSANSGIFSTENGPQTHGNGNQYENNSVQVDGISTVSAVWGGASVITPTEQSVDDVHVMSNDYDAEYGRFAGEQIQVTTKGGTNTIHGSVFFQRWSPGLNAYQPYNGPAFYDASCTSPVTGLPAPCTPSQRNLLRDQQQFDQLGGSLGGPLWKNKLFAFFAYEGERSGVSQVTATGWYDTPAFDALTPAGPIATQYLTYPGAHVSGVLVNQTCANIGLVEGVTCNTIPGQGLNIGSPLPGPPGTQDLTWASSTVPGVGSGLNTTTADIADYTTLNPTTISDDQYNGRVDADVTGKDRLTGTIYWVPANSTYYNGPVRSMNLWHHDVTNDAFTGLWNHIFGPNLLNEARANAAGWRYNEVNSNPQEPFGLPNDELAYTIGSATLQPFGAPGPGIYNQWTYGYSDIVTKIVGRHSFKFGGELTRLYYLNDNPSAARPTYYFFNIWDFLDDAPRQESGDFDPATGTPTDARQDDREDLWGVFVQDDYKVTPSLTLNLGLRYSYFGSLAAKQNDMFSVRFGTGSGLLTGLYLQHGGNLWTPQKLNFGPELGFAYAPRWFQNKIVFRGGFGLNYNQNEIATSASEYSNPGIFVPVNFASSTPAAINPDIVYATATNVHSLYDYPPNPNVISTSATAFGPNGLPTTGTTTLTAFDKNMPTQYVEHYSFGMEDDLGFRNVFSLGYSGSQSRHIYYYYDENAVASVTGIPLNPSVTNVYYFGNNGFGNYNSMIATLSHQMSRGFQVEASYNWAKSLDTGSDPYEAQDYPYDPHLSYGRSDYDVGNLVKIFGAWQPVFFRGSHNWMEKLVGGWSLSGIYNWHTGFAWQPVFPVPGNLYCSTCSTYTQLLPGAYLGGAGRNTSNGAFKSGPGVGNGANSNFPLAATLSGTAYFSIPAYTLGPAFPATGGAIPQSPGIGRNSLPGPRYTDLDATVTKTFGMPKLREGSGLTIRADAFNLFNNLNFNPSDISNNITATNFGQDTGALGGRTVTLQASFDF